MRMMIIWPDIQQSSPGQFSVSDTLSSNMPDRDETEKLPIFGHDPLRKKSEKAFPYFLHIATTKIDASSFLNFF